MQCPKLALLVILALAAVKISSAAPLSSKHCQSTADIVFLVDTSSSIYPPDFNRHVKKFINNVVETFNVGPGPLDSRIGMALFSTNAYKQFYLNKHWSNKDVQAAVNRVRFRGGDTYTHKALDFARKRMFDPRNGARPNISKLVVVLTDGRSRDSRRTLEEAKKLKDSGVDVFALGVGRGADMNEVRAMASTPSDKYAFKVTDFRALDRIRNRFIKSTCQALQISTTPEPTTTTATTTTTTTPTTTTTTTTTPLLTTDESIESGYDSQWDVRNLRPQNVLEPEILSEDGLDTNDWELVGLRRRNATETEWNIGDHQWLMVALRRKGDFRQNSEINGQWGLNYLTKKIVSETEPYNKDNFGYYLQWTPIGLRQKNDFAGESNSKDNSKFDEQWGVNFLKRKIVHETGSSAGKETTSKGPWKIVDFKREGISSDNGYWKLTGLRHNINPSEDKGGQDDYGFDGKWKLIGFRHRAGKDSHYDYDTALDGLWGLEIFGRQSGFGTTYNSKLNTDALPRFNGKWGMRVLKPKTEPASGWSVDRHSTAEEGWELVGLRRQAVTGIEKNTDPDSEQSGQWVLIAMRRKTSNGNSDGVNFVTQNIATEAMANIQSGSGIQWKWDLIELRPKAVDPNAEFDKDWGLNFIRSKIESEAKLNPSNVTVSNGKWEMVDYKRSKGDTDINGEWRLMGLTQKNTSERQMNIPENFKIAGMNGQWQLVGFRRNSIPNGDQTDDKSGFNNMWGLQILKRKSAPYKVRSNGINSHGRIRVQKTIIDSQSRKDGDSQIDGQWEIVGLRRKPNSESEPSMKNKSDNMGQWVVIALRRKVTHGGKSAVKGQQALSFLTNKMAVDTLSNGNDASKFYWKWDLIDLRPNTVDPNAVYDKNWGLKFLQRKIKSEAKSNPINMTVTDGKWEVVDYRRNRGDPGIGNKWGLTGIREAISSNTELYNPEEFELDGMNGHWQLVGFRRRTSSISDISVSESGLDDIWGLHVVRQPIAPITDKSFGIDGQSGYWILGRSSITNSNKDAASGGQWELVGLRRQSYKERELNLENENDNDDQWILIAMRRKVTFDEKNIINGQQGLNFLTHQVAADSMSNDNADTGLYWKWDSIDLRPMTADPDAVFDQQWGLNFLQSKIESETKLNPESVTVSDGKWELVDYRSTRGDPGIGDKWEMTGLRHKSSSQPEMNMQEEYGLPGQDGQWQLVGFRRKPSPDNEGVPSYDGLWGLEILKRKTVPRTTVPEISPESTYKSGFNSLFNVDILKLESTTQPQDNSDFDTNQELKTKTTNKGTTAWIFDTEHNKRKFELPNQWGLKVLSRKTIFDTETNKKDETGIASRWELVGLRRRLSLGTEPNTRGEVENNGQWILIAMRRRITPNENFTVNGQQGLNFLTHQVAAESMSNNEAATGFYWKWDSIDLRPMTADPDAVFDQQWGLNFLQSKIESETNLNPENVTVSDGKWELVDYRSTRGDPGIGDKWEMTGLRHKSSSQPEMNMQEGYGFPGQDGQWQLVGFRRKPSSDNEGLSGYDGLWGLKIMKRKTVPLRKTSGISPDSTIMTGFNSIFNVDILKQESTTQPQDKTDFDNDQELKIRTATEATTTSKGKSELSDQWGLRILSRKAIMDAQTNVNSETGIASQWELVGLRRRLSPETESNTRGEIDNGGQWIVIAMRRRITPNENSIVNGQQGLNFLTHQVAAESMSNIEAATGFYWKWDSVDLRPKTADPDAVFDQQWGLNFLQSKIEAEAKLNPNNVTVSDGNWEMVDYRRTRGDPGIGDNWRLTGVRKKSSQPEIDMPGDFEFSGLDGQWQLVGFKHKPTFGSEDLSGFDSLWGLEILRRNIVPVQPTFDISRKTPGITQTATLTNTHVQTTTPMTTSTTTSTTSTTATSTSTSTPSTTSKKTTTTTKPTSTIISTTTASTPTTTTASTTTTITTKKPTTTTSTTTTTAFPTTLSSSTMVTSSYTKTSSSTTARTAIEKETTANLKVSSTELPQGDDDINPLKGLNFAQGCKGKPADIYFLLDASSSVWIGHFNRRVLKFVRDVVSSFTISPMHTRVGVVTFSNGIDHAFGLADFTDMESLKKAINPDNVEYLTGGTNTGDAINYVTNKAFGSGEAREGVAQIIITVTDGLSQKPRKTSKAAADARKKGIYMFAVGVGKYVDEKELMDISSNPDEDFVFSVDDFTALGSISGLLASKTCKAVAFSARDKNTPRQNDQAVCSSEAANIVFGYTYLNSASDSRIIVQNVITEFTHELQRSAPHIKVGMVSQPCIGGTTSLLAVSRFQKALAQVRSNYYVGYPSVVRKMRTDVFSSVPLTENRIAVLFLDKHTRNIDLLLEEVRKLRFKNVKVIVVAIGEVNQDILNSMVSLPNSNNVIHVQNYKALKEQKLDLLNAICKHGQRASVMAVDNKPIAITTSKPVLSTTKTQTTKQPYISTEDNIGILYVPPN